MALHFDPAVNAQSRSSLVIDISICFVILSSFVVALRIYVRAVLIKAPGLDDLAIGLAQILAIVVSTLTVLEAKYALGRHIWTLPSHDVLKQTKTLYGNILIHNLGMNMIKISFLLQYYRIFSTPTMKRLTQFLLCLIAVWAVVQLPLLALTCFPLSHINPSMAHTCVPTFPSWYFTTYFHIVTDVIIFVVPLPNLITLNLNWKRKLCLVAIFCVGFFTCSISIIRATTLRYCLLTEDPTWDTTDAAWWTVVEINCAVICASLPALRPLLSKLGAGLSSGSTDRSLPSMSVTRPNRDTFERMPGSEGRSENDVPLEDFPSPTSGDSMKEAQYSEHGVAGDDHSSTENLTAVRVGRTVRVP